MTEGAFAHPKAIVSQSDTFLREVIAMNVHPAIRLLLASLIFASAWSSAFAQTFTARSITTTGNAEVHVEPDEAVITLGVEILEKELAAAKRAADLRMQNIIKSVKNLGVEDKDIQTDRLSIRPQYDHFQDRREFAGYRVEQNLNVTVRKLSDFEDILTAVLEAGANTVQGVTFRTSEQRKHLDEARRKAIEAAREKARMMARELGQEIARPLTVVEGGAGAPPPIPFMRAASNIAFDGMGGAADAVAGTVAPGRLTLTAGVTVTFELVDYYGAPRTQD